MVNVFVNYTIKSSSRLRGTKIHCSGAVCAKPGDLLNLRPGRNVTLTITGGYAPRR